MRTITVLYCDTSVWMGYEWGYHLNPFVPNKISTRPLWSSGRAGAGAQAPHALLLSSGEVWQARIQRQHERSHKRHQKTVSTGHVKLPGDFMRRVDFSSIRYIAPLHIIVLSLKYSMAPRNWSNSAVSSKIACWTVHHWICNMWSIIFPANETSI